MEKKIAAVTVILFASLIGDAHECWLQPDKFRYQVGERMKVSFNVGEDFIAEPWNVKRSRLEKLELHHLDKVTDLRDSVQEEAKEKLGFTFKENGTHLVVMQSNHAFIELEAEKFNAYLKEDGLDETLQYRQKNGWMDKPGKENYARYTKLLVQVGDVKDATYKKSAGLPLEIFIAKNPYNIQLGELVKFKVMFQNQPLFGARVVVWNRFDNRTTTQPVYTMKDGTFEARISSKGPWMVSVVKMIPSQNKTADWQSYWGSLVFGIQ